MKDDGSVIWGYQCWWGRAEEGITLEQAQEETEKTKTVIRTVIEAMNTESMSKSRTQSTSPDQSSGGA